MSQYLTINTIAEITCFIIGLFFLMKDSDIVWRSFILFLFLTCVTEMIAIPIKRHYIADPKNVLSNAWLYNILLIFQAIFLNGMFKHLLRKSPNSKPIIISGLALLAILYVYDIFTHGIFEYNNLTNTVMSVLFVLYGFYYFYNLLTADSYINLRISPDFWWVSGILFFYFGATACNLFYEKIKAVLIIHKHYLGYIYNILNIILYSCWSYSFICRRWLTTTSKA